jgi:hypothetical protein
VGVEVSYTRLDAHSAGSRGLREGGEQIVDWNVVLCVVGAVDEQDGSVSIDDDRASELGRVLLGTALPSAEDGTGTAEQNSGPNRVDHCGSLEAGDPITLFRSVDQDLKRHSKLFLEVGRHRGRTHPDCNDIDSPGGELLEPVAQLRDPFAAERSPVMPEPYDDGDLVPPEIAEGDLIAVGVGEPDVGEIHRRHRTSYPVEWAFRSRMPA